VHVLEEFDTRIFMTIGRRSEHLTDHGQEVMAS
jgi:hypothetical protein